MSGKLNYYLTTESMDDFMYSYTAENRSVYEQVFNLDKNSKIELSNALKTNALPAHRAYKYDFFWDNCSTRIRDKIQTAYSEKLEYPVFRPKPFRDYLHDYLQDQPWSKFGIDLVLGLPCDQIANTKEAMFLPMEMMKAYDSTLLGNKLISTHSNEILASIEEPNAKTYVNPLTVSLFILFISIVLKYFNKTTYWSNLIFIITGFAGIIIFFLWFLSDHITTKNNLHFIWANPLVLLFPWRKRLFRSSLLKMLNRVYCILLTTLVIFFPFRLQDMPLACIPIWISLMIMIFPELHIRELFNHNKNPEAGNPSINE